MLSLCHNYTRYNMNKLIEFINICVSNPLVPLSWGIRSIMVGYESVSFFVNGSRYQGKVVIVIVSEIKSLKVFIGDREEYFTDPIDAFSWLDQHIE